MSEVVKKNEYGEVVYMGGFAAAPPVAGLTAPTAIQTANAFLEQHLEQIGISQSRLENDEAGLIASDREGDPIIVVAKEKGMIGATVVVYQQEVLGLPVFNATIGVQINDDSMSVAAMQSAAHANVVVANPAARARETKKYPDRLSKPKLKEKLGFEVPKLDDGRIEQQVVYRYEPEERLEVHDAHEPGGCFGSGHFDMPKLKVVPASIEKGNHYICDEVLFEGSRNGIEAPIVWRALIEPQSGTVLYLRALVACATAMVYDRDPQTKSGAVVTGASSNATLNPFRSSVTLPGLTPSTPQELSGEFVRIVDFSAPNSPPPTAPLPSGTFNFNVRTDEFSAVNAYYHCDRLFRTMQEFGFNVASYFGGTAFPVPVDHRATINSIDGNEVNASAPGNGTGGLREFRFALVQANTPVGMATSNRVVWHEFGHALLWDHVSSPNFGFAHSAGDALAVILNDPNSQEADRGDCFPWVTDSNPGFSRRNDRTIAAGWAWFGPNWNTQYGGEQVMTATMWRAYQSIGGGSTWLPTRRRASETVAFLIFKAIGLLTATTQFPEVFEANLETADKTTPQFKGVSGGALHKVIRWSFEKQGLFQPSASPGQGNNVNTVGNPPDVDVYIDDGRNGEYQYLANHWSCQDMWVRRNSDGGLTHQQPIVNQTNFMYVRVKNRGTQTANNVTVDAYHCLPGTGLAFPDDWQPMATASLPAPGPIPPGGSVIVGPFAFAPTKVGHECLLALAQADGDKANDNTIAGTIPEHRFVPFDNNIGQRNVNPIQPDWRFVVRYFAEHLLVVRNPFRETKVCTVEIKLPKFMRRREWAMKLVSEGGTKFELAPRYARKVILQVEPGDEFDESDVKRAIAEGDSTIELRTFLDGELSGGMTYPFTLDRDDPNPKLKPKLDYLSAASERETDNTQSTVARILQLLDKNQGASGAGSEATGRVRTIRLEFDIDDDTA